MKIILYMDWGLAFTYLEPIYKHLKKLQPDWQILFVANDIFGQMLVNQAGYQLGNHGDSCDWAICCDKLSACPTKNRIVVFHGLASKGQEFCKNDRNVNPDDISVVASKYYKKLYTERDGADPDKVIVGGMTKFDTITKLPEPNKVPKILYAPTHNPSLTSIDVLGKRVYELDNIKVHLHFYTRNSANEAHQPLRKVMQHHDTREDITEMMVESDIVIADLGSTVLEALALGKMVIQVICNCDSLDCPKRKRPDYLDWYLSRIGEEQIAGLPEIDLPNRFAYQAHDIDEVKEIIKKYPDYKKPDFEIVENIGNYQVSQIIYDYIRNNPSSR